MHILQNHAPFVIVTVLLDVFWWKIWKLTTILCSIQMQHCLHTWFQSDSQATSDMQFQVAETSTQEHKLGKKEVQRVPFLTPKQFGDQLEKNI